MASEQDFPTVVKRFWPKEDITAYELALLWSNIPVKEKLEEVWFSKRQWEQLPDGLKRHFE